MKPNAVLVARNGWLTRKLRLIRVRWSNRHRR